MAQKLIKHKDNLNEKTYGEPKGSTQYRFAPTEKLEILSNNAYANFVKCITIIQKEVEWIKCSAMKGK